ncbi:MAG: hypothetical protein JNK46_15680 [Methylobacteriaceae bacterium]|nr:hypothetical protein [Methylobacteriaceae bacterium]
MTGGPLWISDAEVERLLDPRDLIAAVEAGFAAVGRGDLGEAGSTRLDGLDGAGAYLTLYPAHDRSGFASVKLLAGRPANADEGRPEIDAVVALVEPRAGRGAALISARALTALRTAAATVAALRRLAPRGPCRIGLVGAGGQARAHARVLAAAGLAESFCIASPRGEAARAATAAEAIAATTGVATRAVETGAIGGGSDIVILMTLARTPVAIGALAPDAVLASIGPFYPQAQELDPAVVARAAFVVSDDPARLARQWAGSTTLDVAALAPAALADLIAGRVAPRAGLRVFLSDGRAFQDNVAASLVYATARRAGRGLELP